MALSTISVTACARSAASLLSHELFAESPDLCDNFVGGFRSDKALRIGVIAGKVIADGLLQVARAAMGTAEARPRLRSPGCG